MSALCKRLDELWEENEGSVVLFTWIQFLKEETLGFLEVQSPLLVMTHDEIKAKESSVKEEGDAPLDSRAIVDLDNNHDLAAQLLDFNEEQWQKVFNLKMLNCGICFSEKLGADCLYFKICNHVYCNECMAEYFTINIRDGNVQCLSCPEPNCTSIATPEQVPGSFVRSACIHVNVVAKILWKKLQSFCLNKGLQFIERKKSLAFGFNRGLSITY